MAWQHAATMERFGIVSRIRHGLSRSELPRNAEIQKYRISGFRISGIAEFAGWRGPNGQHLSRNDQVGRYDKACRDPHFG